MGYALCLHLPRANRRPEESTSPTANARCMKHRFLIAFVSVAISGCAAPAVHADFSAQTAPSATVAPADFGALKWRIVGPAVMGGRLDAVAGVPGDPNTIYLAHSSGGLYVSTDGGMTFAPTFDAGRTTAIGAICCCAVGSAVLYAGTGESFPRNTARSATACFAPITRGRPGVRADWRNAAHREDRDRSDQRERRTGCCAGTRVHAGWRTRCLSHDRRVPYVAACDLGQSDDRRQRRCVRSYQFADRVRGHV